MSEHFGWPDYILNPDVYHSQAERDIWAKAIRGQQLREVTYAQERAEERRQAQYRAKIQELEKGWPAGTGQLSYAKIALLEWRLGVGDLDVADHYRAIRDGLVTDAERRVQCSVWRRWKSRLRSWCPW